MKLYYSIGQKTFSAINHVSVDSFWLKDLYKFYLSDYFTPHLGEYVNVLSALEKLNVAILKAMDKTKEVGFDGFSQLKYGKFKKVIDIKVTLYEGDMDMAEIPDI